MQKSRDLVYTGLCLIWFAQGNLFAWRCQTAPSLFCAHPTPTNPQQLSQEYIDISEPIDFRSQLEGGAWIDFVIGGMEKDKQGRLGLEEKTKIINIMG